MFYLVVLLVVVVVLLVVVLLAGLLSKLMLLANIFLEDPPVDLGKSSGMILLLVETDVRSDLEAVTKSKVSVNIKRKTNIAMLANI